MTKIFRTAIRWLRSDNLKSKTCPEPRRRIQNLKWVGFLAIVVSLMGWAGMAEAQQANKVPRIGFQSAAFPAALSARMDAFRQGLRELGYVEGKNIVIEYRYAEGKLDRLHEFAAEFVRLKVDVIVTAAPSSTRAAKEATSTIPIVMAYDSDPVGTGFVDSLARPGGNITGLSLLSPELSTKRLELIKEIVTGASRVAVFWNPDDPPAKLSLKETQTAAKVLAVQLQILETREPDDFESAFRAATKGRARALDFCRLRS